MNKKLVNKKKHFHYNRFMFDFDFFALGKKLFE